MNTVSVFFVLSAMLAAGKVHGAPSVSLAQVGLLQNGLAVSSTAEADAINQALGLSQVGQIDALTRANLVNLGVGSVGGVPLVIGGSQALVEVPTVVRRPPTILTPAPALSPAILGRAAPAGIPVFPRLADGIGFGIGGNLDLGIKLRG